MLFVGYFDFLLVVSWLLVCFIFDWFEGFFSGVSRRLLKVDEGQIMYSILLVKFFIMNENE